MECMEENLTLAVRLESELRRMQAWESEMKD